MLLCILFAYVVLLLCVCVHGSSTFVMHQHILHYYGDGNITIREMGTRLEKKKIEFGIPSNYKTTIKTKTSQQSNKEISSSILKLLKQMGKSEVLYGQGNINVQIIDGKLVLKDTKGAFGTGLFGTEYKITGETNKTILLEIKKFLENKEKQSQSSSKFDSNNDFNYNGDANFASVLILKEPTIAILTV